MIKRYSNKAAWDAETKSITESTLGLLNDTVQPITNPVNVKDVPVRVGDIVLYDANNEVHFIAGDSYKAAPSGWTAIGVVGAVRGKKVLVVHKNNAAKKWADVYEWKISGWTLDSADHTTNVVLHNTAAVSFTYNAATLADVATQLNTWLATNQPEGYTYKARVVNSELILTLLTYTAYQNTHSFSGLTLTAFTGTELPETSSIYWDATRTTYWAQMNAERFYTYFKTNGRVPTAQVAVKAAPADPVKQTEFNTSAFCDLLRAAYCADPSSPTDADYRNYLAQEFTVVKPDMRGVLQPSFRDGHANTYALVGKTYEDAEGTAKEKYPAAEYCADVNYAGVKGFEAGDWFLPSMTDLYEIIDPVTYPAPNATAANADALNRGLAKIGGNQVGNGSYLWASCRFNTNNAWIFYGSSGKASSYYFCYGCTAVPVALFEL